MLPASIPHPKNQTTLTFSLVLPFTSPVFPFSSNCITLPWPDHSLILSIVSWQCLSNNTCHNTHKIPAPHVEWVWLGLFFPFEMTKLLVWQPQMEVLYFLISLESTGLQFSILVHILLPISFHFIMMLLNSPPHSPPINLKPLYCLFTNILCMIQVSRRQLWIFNYRSLVPLGGSVVGKNDTDRFSAL